MGEEWTWKKNGMEWWRWRNVCELCREERAVSRLMWAVSRLMCRNVQ